MSSTYLSQILGGLGEVLRALTSKSSINRLATTGFMGDPIAVTCTCLKYLPLNVKKVLFRQCSRRVTMFWTERGLLLWSSVSYCSLLQMTSRAGSTGTGVNRAFPCHNWMDLVCSTECCVFLICWGNHLPEDKGCWPILQVLCM